MASPPGPPAWSVTMRLRHRSGLEIRAAAENVLPGWGRGGERLSLLFRLRRRVLLAVTSQCGTRPPPPTKTGAPPCGSKILRFLRSRWARVTSIWWRKKRAAAAAMPGRRPQVTPSRLFWQNRASPRQVQSCRAWTPTAVATPQFTVFAVAVAVAVASIAMFRLMVCIGCLLRGGHWNWRGGCDGEPIVRCTSWRCFMATKVLELLEHPPLYCNYKWLLGLPKHGLKWLLSK
ncbi:uncharacterized protein LOC133885580 [Phragmites australis]|uniref:uncharacterized protein LOC133885580 n=1 Tax=Phragmites australis TaxID=29695 RepID=UPI002D767822|nr:uncharacterized protein LOC133885580 [Phragmites australis]